VTARYADVLRAPHVASLLAAALVARLPIAVESLATVLFLREETGSFAVAGGVAGALVVGSGIGSPVVSRLIDRVGVRRVLLPVAAVHAGGLLALVLLGGAGAPVLALVAAAAVVGFTIPPTSAVLRSLWPSLLAHREDLLPTAYALDSVLIEFIFVFGPLLTAGLVSFVSPAAALAVSAVAVGVGTVAFAALPPTRERTPEPHAATGGRLGALATPGMRTLVVTMVPVGVCFGSIEVSLPAFGAEQGDAAWGGVLLAAWSLGSAAGGFVYGARERTWDLVPMWLVLMALVPLGVVPMLAAGSVWSMLVLCLPAGIAIAPLLATGNQLIGRVAPPGAATEAYTWPLTAMVAGMAAGTALAGSLAEHEGWRAGVGLGIAAGAVAILLAAARRRTLPGAVPPLATVP
jgi:MFS family permease